MRAGLADLIQEELARPCLENIGDEFAMMFWSTADTTLRNQMTDHWMRIKCEQQRMDGVKDEISQRVREACSSDVTGFLDILTTHLAAVPNYWKHCYEDPFDLVSGSLITRGTQMEWPNDANYVDRTFC